MSAWDIAVNGSMINTLGSGVSKLTGVGGITGRSFYNSTNFSFDGEASQIGGFAAGVWGMTVWVDDRNRATGERPAELEQRQAQAFINLQWLTGLFTVDYLLNVSLRMPSLSTTLTETQKTRVSLNQLTSMSQPTANDSMTRYEVVLGFKIPDVYWRSAGGADLDASGWKTITQTYAIPAMTLPTDVYPMNGFIEDAVIKVTAGSAALSGITIKALNQGTAALTAPFVRVASPRTGGLLPAGKGLVIDLKAHSALIDAENVIKFASWGMGRPGSLLRIGSPYSLSIALTPVTSGASVADATWSVKYRPSFV